MSRQSTALILVERIGRKILLLRGQKVMLDSDLAELYGVEVKALNQAMKRNLERFPEDFMFRLSKEEFRLVLKSQVVTSSTELPLKSANNRGILKSQIVTSSWGHGGRRKLPYAFTEQGVAMLSSVLRSDRAVQVNIAIMRTFVLFRQMLASHADLARKLETMEKQYDASFRMVFDAIRKLMSEKKKPRREIGFHTLMPKPGKVDGAKAKRIAS